MAEVIWADNATEWRIDAAVHSGKNQPKNWITFLKRTADCCLRILFLDTVNRCWST